VHSGYEWHFDEVGMRKRVARGGRGGLGNFEFRSSTNQAPHIAQPGTPGARATLQLDMKFIADVGLIGLPSSGKSSLLNTLTHAHAKVGAYPFTTLEPNLGALGTKIIADIPGLIEGAHHGKGLGIRFLKHIEKTKVLLHCIVSESGDVVHDYMVVRKELEEYNPELLTKKEIILLTKSDLVDNSVIKARTKALKKYGTVLSVSIINDQQLQKLATVLQTV
jgi:GTP-binding protein